MTRPSRGAFAGVLLLAGSVILLQIALTRVLAIMMWHHLTYMVISLALLGFGASGSILTARRVKTPTGSPVPAIGAFTAAYAVSVLAALWMLRLINVDSLELWVDAANLVQLLALFLITATPFLLGGFALGLALTRFSEHVNRVYCFDLVGSGLGGAASVWILQSVGASGTVLAAAALGLLAALCFAVAAGWRTRLGLTPAVGLGVAGILAFSPLASDLGLPTLQWQPPFAVGKTMHPYNDHPELDRIYSATAEVEVGPSSEAIAFIGGDIGASAAGVLNGRVVGQDGAAPTMLIENASDLERYEFLKHTQTASAHVALTARGGKDPDVLVIGVGGGIDVMVSLLHGAKRVTAAEINSAMVEMVTERYDDYIGGLFRPGAHPIELVNREGRSFVSSSSEQWDIIQMSGVDSLAALSTGAYTLSESYLYTTEAVKLFYEHLTDDGYINYSRGILAHPQKPRQTLRLAHIACTALRELGIEDPGAHLVVFRGRGWASTMIKRSPFTAIEIDALRAYAQREGFVGLIFDPLRSGNGSDDVGAAYVDFGNLAESSFDRLIEQSVPATTPEQRKVYRERLLEVYPLILKLRQATPEELPELEEIKVVVEELSEDFPEVDRAAAKRGFGSVVWAMHDISYATMGGVPESIRTFRTLLAGTEAEREQFLKDYEHDVSACTDDTPFFFNSYKYSALLDQLLGNGDEHSAFPVGHMVLLSSLVMIVLLAAVSIFLPLRKLARRGLRAAGTWRYFAYFAALGTGFMFVEIVLMQKMVVFLGHPTYAISVVLASLLAFAGLGSLLAGRITQLSRPTLALLGLAIVAVIAASIWLMNSVAPGLLGLPLALRVAIAVAVVLPLGLVLGVPFPTGMRIVEHNCPQLLPWCWAVNGFLSVFAAIFCILLAMQLGFTTVLWIAAGIYAVGIALMPSVRASSAA